MRSYDPDDEDDVKTLFELNAEEWMIAHLKLNPEYPHWGPGEDYMTTAKDEDHAGLSSSLETESWAAFGPCGLDECNECVHFYFQIQRDAKRCAECELGYSPQARQFHNEWYGTATPPFDPAVYGAAPLTLDHPKVQAFATRNVARHPDFYGGSQLAVDREARRLHEMWAAQWSCHLIQADVDALVAGDRLRDLTRDGHTPTADEVNAWSIGGMGHDAINESICVRARCEREGVPVECPACGGSASIYTAPAAYLNLVVWMLHPRKGCSRGIRIKNLSRTDAAAARAWLRVAAQRNADRFAKLAAL